MKIKLKSAKSLGFDRDMASIGFKHPQFARVFDNAIIDTGCPYVIISESVIKTRRMPYKKYPKLELESPLNLGGILMELRDLGECSIFMFDTNDKLNEFKHRAYVGVSLTPINMKLPSFIGIDFLKKNKLSINFEEDGSYLIKSQ